MRHLIQHFIPRQDPQGLYAGVLIEVLLHIVYGFDRTHVFQQSHPDKDRENIDYPAYRERGYFIESGNKTILQSRLKQAGMQWNPVTAQYMLSLKTKEKSRLWYTTVIPLIWSKMG